LSSKKKPKISPKKISIKKHLIFGSQNSLFLWKKKLLQIWLVRLFHENFENLRTKKDNSQIQKLNIVFLPLLAKEAWNNSQKMSVIDKKNVNPPSTFLSYALRY